MLYFMDFTVELYALHANFEFNNGVIRIATYTMILQKPAYIIKP